MIIHKVVMQRCRKLSCVTNANISKNFNECHTIILEIILKDLSLNECVFQ